MGDHGGVKQSVDPGGIEYNYASASTGAKVSAIKVYWDRTLEDLISFTVKDDVFVPVEGTAHRKPLSSPQEFLRSDDLY